MKLLKVLVAITYFTSKSHCVDSEISANSNKHYGRQIEIGDGIRLTDFVVYYFMSALPGYFPDKTAATPVFFWPYFKQVPQEILRILGFPDINYDDTSVYSLNQLVKEVSGVSTLELISILAMAFLASIVLVSILLPNIYFRLMLLADNLVEQQEDGSAVE